MKAIFYTVCISSALLLGCDDATSTPAKTVSQDILRVQGLIYDYDRSVTLGGVLNHRKDCISPTWETLTDEQERPLVVYKCQLAEGALQTAINHDLTHWYQSTINNMEGVKSRLANAEPLTLADQVTVPDLSSVLHVVTTITRQEFDWSLIRQHIKQNYFVAYEFEFIPNYQPSEEEKQQLAHWNSLMDPLRAFRYEADDVSKILLSWLNQEPNAKQQLTQLETRLRQSMVKRQKQIEEAMTPFKAQQNVGIQETQKYIHELKQAQTNSSDWALTQIFIWSLVNPEKPVLTHALFSLEDSRGREDFTPWVTKVMGQSARTDALAWVYQDKMSSKDYINNLAKSLFFYQIQSITKPEFSHYRY
ncbi:hypothetical protein AB7W14_12615 [Providencia rettgeri]